MKAMKNTAASMYLRMMKEAAASEGTPPTEHKQPQRLIGGCLLYHLPLVRRKQHPPAPYYS